MSKAPQNLAIEPARPEQVPLVVSFIRKLAEYEKLAHEVVADEALMHEALFGSRPAAEVVLAWLDGNPVGFAVFFTNFSTFAGRPGIYLEDLFVEPQARGQGIGRALLRHLAKLALSRGCARFEWAVLDWNTPSIAFYESLGARPMDDWTVYRLSGPALEDLAK
ncbi:MAG TPA: GNAT family N-acetyltransferase [Bryobacteraceae bacterium]|jgi:GNAT superfamily N-acetyltransferase|nr:GNAT family N-acetyltransferase [Bryobacteraceae bacterium]